MSDLEGKVVHLQVIKADKKIGSANAFEGCIRAWRDDLKQIP